MTYWIYDCCTIQPTFRLMTILWSQYTVSRILLSVKIRKPMFIIHLYIQVSTFSIGFLNAFDHIYVWYTHGKLNAYFDDFDPKILQKAKALKKSQY